MKILYISPENTVGVLSLWKKSHEERGNECRYLTFFRTASGYAEDICLDLPFVSSGKFYDKIRRLAYRTHGELGPETEKEGYPPIWKPQNAAESLFFKTREFVWSGIVDRAIKKYKLEDFDIYHFEWGMEFYRDGRFVKRLKELGKKIVCTYHGQDMRNRGVIQPVDELSDLNLTSELDLMYMHPKINYLFLPFDTSRYKARTKLNDIITVSHATTNRLAKGTDHILEICSKLENEGRIKFIFVEKRPHSEVLEVKSNSDIYVDQITDIGWGYGMNSVEALSMGVVCLVNMNKKYNEFIPDHPFIHATVENLETKLIELVNDRDNLRRRMAKSRDWVVKKHDVRNVVENLYEYYSEKGWL